MPEYLSPGVYVEEIAGPRPIEGVSTSTAGFVGQTERGPTTPRLVTSWSSYQRWFGGEVDPATSFLPFAVKGFFDNGGQRAYVARIHNDDAVTASDALATGNANQTLQVQATGAGSWGDRLFVRIDDDSLGRADHFRLTILYYRNAPPVPLADPFDPATVSDPNRRVPDVVEDYNDLGIDPEGPNYVLNRVNSSSKLVELSWGDAAVDPARPDNAGYDQISGAQGDDGANTAGANEYEGDSALPPDRRTGLAGLEIIDPISLLCVPDEVHPTLNAANQGQLRNAIVNQCERLGDRFAILQLRGGEGDVGAIPQPDPTSYAAIYWPWIRVFDARTQGTLLVPPGGHVAGIYARTDIERGVHKAPANEVVRGIITREINATRRPLEFHVGKREQDILNPRGINVIRDFRADRRGIRVWGARTLSDDPQWRYVPVRRLFLFIEESIDEGTQWVVFEPNHEPTWAKVRRSVTNFLITVWRNGALQGVTQDEAFFVKCDRTTMSQDDIDNGRLICLIGVAPVKPAEFVIFRISQKTIEAA